MNEFMRIGDICDILNGYAFKSSKYVADGIRVIRITNVQKGFVEDTNPQYYPVSEQREIEKYMLCEGDLLMSLTGNVGRVGLLSAEMLPAALNQRVACIRIRNPAVIYKPFLFHLLNSDYFENKCILASQGVAQKNMSTEWLKEYPIPSFSMDKQMEIASFFDKIDDLIAHRKEQVRNMDQAVKSRFIELFGDPKQNPKGYPVKEFDEISVLITDGEHATPRRTDKGIYLLSARNILNHALQLDDVDYIDEEEYTRIARRVVPQAGDVLISCSGSIGRCCVVPEELRFQMVRSAALIRFDDTINPVFAEWLITSDELQRQISMSATQSSQANLFQGKIRKLRGYVPPMELQEQFAAFVEQTDKSKFYIVQMQILLRLLIRAIQQKTTEVLL